MPAEATALNLQTPSKAATIERLREQIRKVEAAPRQYLVTLATGIRELDALGVFRLGSGVELSGEEGAGRASVALALAASACREKRLVAWVDGPQELYPPAAEAVGVELRRFLMVRPKNPGQLVWAATQLLRSGAFTLVVLDLTHTGVLLSMGDTKKLLDAARTGGSLLVALTAGGVHAPGLLRLGLRTQPPAVNEGAHVRAGHLRLLAAAPTPASPRRGTGALEAAAPPAVLPVDAAGQLGGRKPSAGAAAVDARAHATPAVAPEPVGECPADAVVLEVERASASSAGGLGRTVAFRRSSLVRRGKPWAPRARHVRWEGLAVPSVTPLEVLRRVKPHDLREGHGGFYGQHPRQLSLARGGARHG